MAGAAARQANVSPIRSLRMGRSLLPAAYLAGPIQKREGAIVGLSSEECFASAGEQVAGFDQVEQGQAGPQLHRIDAPQDLFSAAAADPGQDRFNARAKPP